MEQNIESDMTAVTYRSATPLDAHCMEKLNLATLPENYNIAEWISALQYMGHYSYVALVNKEMVGYCLASSSLDHSRSDSRKKTFVGTIASIAVKKDWRRKGIAKKLIMKSLLTLTHCDRVTLTVRVSNANAINLYKRMGFIQEKIVEKYYKDKEDAIQMLRVSK